MRASTVNLSKWGGLACFVLAIALVIPPFIYLTGDLRSTFGAFAYDVADLLYGPVWAASLVITMLALREVIEIYGPRRMTLAFLAAVLAAGAMVAVACIRSANRHYHINHPELHLENSTEVLVVWTTILAGITATGWHFLGWAMLLVGSIGWTSRSLPLLLSALYLGGGAVSLFVYTFADLEGAAVLLATVVSIWQGSLLWRGELPADSALQIAPGPPDGVRQGP